MSSISQQNVPALSTPALVTVPAKSSWIAAFEYDAANLTLTTHLKSGAIYQHKFVTPLDWQTLQASQNHAKHWADSIKGKKICVRIKSAKAPKGDIK